MGSDVGSGLRGTHGCGVLDVDHSVNGPPHCHTFVCAILEINSH